MYNYKHIKYEHNSMISTLNKDSNIKGYYPLSTIWTQKWLTLGNIKFNKCLISIYFLSDKV